MLFLEKCLRAISVNIPCVWAEVDPPGQVHYIVKINNRNFYCSEYYTAILLKMDLRQLRSKPDSFTNSLLTVKRIPEYIIPV